MPRRASSNPLQDRENRWKRMQRRENQGKRFGLTGDDVSHLIARQGGACLICRRPGTQKTPLVVDHDHETGLVRGLLCDRCNLGLGHFRDDPKLLTAAILYLGRAAALRDWGFLDPDVADPA